MVVYIIGSLRNARVTEIAKQLREANFEAFDDWMAAGPEADDYWQRYEQARGNTFVDALNGYAAQHVFNYDRSHLDRATVGVLVMPAGKSGHLELGYLIGQGKPCFILMDEEPERFDVMYAFAAVVVHTVPQLIEKLEFLKRREELIECQFELSTNQRCI